MTKKPFGLLMIITLFFGCSHYIPKSTSMTPSTLADDNKKTFLDTAINMGQDIVQDIQNVFWSAGDILSSMLVEHTVIKSDDKRSKIKEHFDTVANELTTIKNELNNKVRNENTTQNANNVIDKIITAVKKLAEAGVTDANLRIGEIKNNHTTKASIVSNKNSVQNIIDGIKEIVNIAENSGINIKKQYNGNYDSPVKVSDNNSALAALNGGGNQHAGAGQEAGSALVQAVSEIDPWAMIDKISHASTTSNNIHGKNDNNAGELITGYTNENKGAGAKTKADLAAAVALKAMSKDGQFTALINGDNNDKYVKKVKDAAADAVNKVLKTLDTIIGETLKVELYKVKIKL